MATANRRIDLSPDEIALLRESLDYSIRNVGNWHAQQGSPETADVGREKVTALSRLRQKLTAATKRAGGD